MTTTPEVEAFVREVAAKRFGTSVNGLMMRIMSVAIMEASEKAAAFLEGKAARNEETAGWTESLSVRKNSKRDACKRRSDAQAIRNWEHLK